MASPRGSQNSSWSATTTNAFLHNNVKCNCKYFEVSAVFGWYTASDSAAAALCLCLLLCVSARGESRWYRYAKSLPPTLVTHQHVTEQDLHLFQNISISVIHSRLSRLFISSFHSWEWRQHGHASSSRQQSRAGSCARPVQLCLPEATVSCLRTEQKCPVARAASCLSTE